MRLSEHRGRRLGAGWAAFALMGVLAVPVSARLQEGDAAKKDIQAALDQSCKCMASKDLEGYSKNLTTDYRRIDYFGETTDREKSLAYLKTMIEPADDIHSTATIESIKMKGNDATVLVRTKGQATAKNGDGKAVPVSWEQREVQVWTKTADGWRLRDNMGLTETVMLDGKPYTPETTDEVAAARTSIQSVYNALVRAAVEDNAESVRKVVPASFVAYPTTGGAPRNREELLGMMREELGTKAGPADFILGRARVNGDKAVVLGELRVESTETVDGKPVKTTTTTWHRDVWQKDAEGKWQPVEFRPILRERSVGGKIGAAIYSTPGPRS